MDETAAAVAAYIKAGNDRLAARDLGAACIAYSRALNLDPRQATAHYNLGAVLLMAGRAADGLPCLLTASQLQPGTAQFAIGFARALLESGQRDRAARALAAAHTINPDDAALRDAAAKFPVQPDTIAGTPAGDAAAVLVQTGAALAEERFTEAFELATQLSLIAPDQPDAWMLLSQAARRTASGEFAEMCARRAVALAPAEPGAWVNLGEIIGAVPQRRDDVEQLLRQGLVACRQAPEIVAALGGVFAAAGRDDELAALLDAAGASAGLPYLPFVCLQADMLERRGDLDAAARVYEAASLKAPKDSGLVAAAAVFHDRQLDPAPMQFLFEQARANGVDLDRDGLRDAEARILLRVGELDQAHGAITRALELPGDPNQMRSRYFTLGRVEDKRARYAEAFAAMADANRLMETVWEQNGPCDPDMVTGRLHSLQQRLTDEINTGRSAVADAGAGPANIAFLVGFSRSGTTLLDTILRAHSRVRVIEEEPILINALRDVVPGIAGDESNFTEDWLDRIHGCDPARLRMAYLDQMSAFSGETLSDERVYIDKLPLNMNWAPLLQTMFPRAVFVLAGRHPLDVAISNLFQDYKPNNAMLNMTRLERIDRLYDLSFSLWDAFASWRRPTVHEVRYEGVVEDLEAEIAPLMQGLGLEWEPAQARFRETALKRGRIKTPSATQVTQNLYSSSVERWRRYGFALKGSDTARLREWAQRQGYSL